MMDYPTQSILMTQALITRWRLLPEGVLGNVNVREGDSVSPNDVVASGVLSSDYRIIDVATALGMKPDDERLAEILDFQAGDTIEADAKLGHTEKRSLKRRLPVAPAKSKVVLVENGRVILQLFPEEVKVKARIPGEVVQVEDGLGVAIQTHGAVLQCAWGNGQVNTSAFVFEPGSQFADSKAASAGLRKLADLRKQDVLLSPYRGKVVILMRPLVPDDLDVVEQQELGGIVAPCASPYLREKAMQLKVPIILTEGFGKLPMTTLLYETLAERVNAQAIFDATAPNVQNNERPEIIIPGGSAIRDAQEPDTQSALHQGQRVRIRRAPYSGRIGLVTDLPVRPITIENGLRVLCAQIKLQSGESIMVPRANLETLGELS